MSLLFLQPIDALAEGEPFITDEYLEEQESPSYGERFVTSLIMSPINLALDLFGARDVSYLIFQQPELDTILGLGDNDEEGGGSNTSESLVFGVFPNTYFDGVAMFYDEIRNLLPVPIVIIMTFAGLVLLVSNFRSEARSKFKDYITGLIFVVLCLRFGHLLWGFIFDINYFLVNFVWKTLEKHNIPAGKFLNTIWGDNLSGIIDQATLGIAILAFIAIFMTFVLNYQYALRMIVLSILIIIFPLVVLGAVFPSRREGLNLWFHEFTSQVFMQSAHAFALGMFFYMRFHLGDISFWVLCAYFFGLPTVTSLVQRVVGTFTGVQTSGGVSGGMGSAMGLMAAMNIARMVRGSKSNRSATKGSKGSSSSSGSMRGGTGTGLRTSTDRTTQGGRISLSNGRSQRRGTGHHLGFANSGRQQIESLARFTRSVGRSPLGRTTLRGAGAFVGAGALGMATGNASIGAMGGVMGAEELLSRGANKNEEENHLDEPMNIPRLPKENLSDSKIPLNDRLTPKVTTGTRSTLPLDNRVKAAVSRSNNNYKRSRNQLSGMNRADTVPAVYKAHQRSAAQARAVRQSAMTLQNRAETMATPAQAVTQFERAEQNYQSAQSLLSSIDRNEQPDLHAQQRAIIGNARTVMEQTRSYALQHHGDAMISPPSHQPIQEPVQPSPMITQSPQSSPAPVVNTPTANHIQNPPVTPTQQVTHQQPNSAGNRQTQLHDDPQKPANNRITRNREQMNRLKGAKRHRGGL